MKRLALRREPSAASGKKRVVDLPGGRRAERPDASGPLRVVDSLALMLKNGSIDTAQHDAGRAFAGDFAAASFAGNTTVNLTAAGRGRNSASESVTEAVAHARRRVHRALDAVGGMGSLGGSALWDVCGLGLSVQQWAANQQLNRNTAKGMLVAALDVVAKVYYFKV